MKKSNALMLSYMIFLAITILAEIIFKWEGLDRISMAATIAGCFFAFADLANWYVSNNIPMIDAVKKDINVFIASCNAKVDTLRANRQEMLDVIETITPYQKRDDKIISLIQLCEERAKNLESTINDLQKTTVEGNDELNALLNKEVKRIEQYQNAEIVLVTVGFVSFFVLIAFDYLANLIEPHQSIATVLAFIIIMLNYFLRDILDEKTKRDVEEMLEKVEQQKDEVRQIRESAKDTPWLDKVNILVEQIEEIDGLKKEKFQWKN